jgi:hypothetical protein
VTSTLRVGIRADTRDLHRDLEAIELGLGKTLTVVMQEAAQIVVRDIPAHTPYDPHHRPLRRDAEGNEYAVAHVRDTFQVRSAGAGVVKIVSDHPGAGVLEYGGTIKPKGALIHIREFGMAHKAAEAQADRLGRALDDGVDALMRQHNL